MCNHVQEPGGREGAMVIVSPGVWCDPCLVPLIQALNGAGIETIASCCGHGYRPGNVTLADGRELVIAQDFEEARLIDSYFPIDVNGHLIRSGTLIT